MSREESAVFTNMCMVYDGKGNVLVQNRNDPNWPGIVFPGGHVEKGESFVASVIREVKEETGVDIQNPVLCGVKQFQTEENARYVVLLFKTGTFSGEPRGSSEGDAFWIPREELFTRPVVKDFREMVEAFEREDISELYYEETSGGEARPRLY